MSSVLEEDAAQTVPTGQAATRLRTTMAAIRVVFTWLGTTKTLSTDQKVLAADAFGAEGTAIAQRRNCWIANIRPWRRSTKSKAGSPNIGEITACRFRNQASG